MYCLDTNIVIDIFHGDEDLKLKLQKVMDSAEIFITPLSLCELYKGVYLFPNPEKELMDLNQFISSFDLLDFTSEACQIFGKEYAHLKKIGKMTQESDLMIAAIAKAHELIVVTRNKKHFENIDVKLEVW